MENHITKVKKRDGRVVEFDQDRITNAIFKAEMAVGDASWDRAKEISDKVVEELNRKFAEGYIPGVEEIQDVVEEVLIKVGRSETAKAYILYRKKRTEIREEKKKILNKDHLDEIDKRFSVNALRVLASRYLKRDKNGKIVESPRDLFSRVALTIVLPEILYSEENFNIEGKEEPKLEGLKEYKASYENWDGVLKIGKYKLNKYHFERFIALYEELALQGHMKRRVGEIIQDILAGKYDHLESMINDYFDLMTQQIFIPNSPTLMNAGRKLGMLSACFVLDVEDNLESIMELARNTALIHKSGGGTGTNFSKLRPKGSLVASTMGTASGPVSFMRIIDTVTDVVKQGGVRRGANMGILEVWHPDIEEFINIKNTEGILENFNISVGIWSDFFEALKKKEKYPLINPHTKKVEKYVHSNDLFEMLSYSAWNKADPGVLFFDNINKRNVLKKAFGDIRATNPCGEEPLYPFESCNLGSINVAKFVDSEGNFDWEEFKRVIKLATKALDNIISMNKYPIKEINNRTKETRRIGLGMMGVADALYKMGIGYNTEEGYKMMSNLAEFLTFWAFKTSIELAKEKGKFPIFDKTSYVDGELPIEGYYHKELWTQKWDELVEEIKKYGLRNAAVTTNAPTGSISMIADTSNGIEPLFALVYEKRVTVGNFFYVDPVFEKALKERGLYREELLQKISENYGSLQGLSEIPEDMKKVFVTSMDVHWIDHVIAQGTLQRWITDSISKTINMPNDVTVEDVKQAYLLAHYLGCKGVTVYRDGSKSSQVLNIVAEEKSKKIHAKPSDYALRILDDLLKEEEWLKEYLSGLLEKAITNNHKLPEEEVLEKIPDGKEIEEENVGPLPESKDMPKGEDVCPMCGGRLIYEAGCAKCIECGWSACTVS